jgi:hypothetical protein
MDQLVYHRRLSAADDMMIKSQCIKVRSSLTHLFEQTCTFLSKRIIRGVSSPSPTRDGCVVRLIPYGAVDIAGH